MLLELLSKDWCGVIEEVKEPYELVWCFIGEIFEGEWCGGAMDEGEKEEPGEELSIFFGDDELLGADSSGGVAVRVSGSGGSGGRCRRRSGGSGSKECGVEEEGKSFALVVGKFDGMDLWWCRRCWRSGGGVGGGVGGRLTVVGGENEGEEFFGVGRGVK